MKKITNLLTLLFFATVFSFGVTAQDASVDLRKGMSFRVSYVNSEEGLAEAILIKAKASDGMTFWLVSQLPFERDINQDAGVGKISEDDINFDGIPDLQVSLGSMDSYGNFCYDGYVWNEEEQCFEAVSKYSDIYNPELDKGTRTVRGVWRQGDDFEFTTYVWKDGELVKTEERRENLSVTE